MLEAGQALIDALPARSDQVDQKRQVVDPRVPFGEQVAVEPLEPPDEVCGQAAYLGEMPRDRQHLLAEAGLDRFSDAVRQRRLERCSGLGQGFDLVAGPLERGCDGRSLRSALGHLAQPLVRPFDGAWIHGSQR